jgi:hypothetical protein
MAMGQRTRDRQQTMWVAATELPTAASHPFYARLNRMLADQGVQRPQQRIEHRMSCVMLLAHDRN